MEKTMRQVAWLGFFILLSGLLDGQSLARGDAAAMQAPYVYYLANEGVMLVNHNQRVLVDFPFSGKFDWCVSPTADQIQALLERKPPFVSIDAFLFTHDHVDHFDPGLVKKALVAHPEAILAGTAKVIERLRQVDGEPIKNTLFVMSAGNNVACNKLSIEPLIAPHARYWDIDPATGQRVIRDDGYIHLAYRVSMADFSFIHGGDAYEIAIPASTQADVLLLDRGFMRIKGIDALKAIHQRVHARRTILMHIGPSEIATINKLIAAESDWLSALTEAGQSVNVF